MSGLQSELVCEVCKTDKDLRKAPWMTGVGFNAPDNEQRVVCIECFRAWYEYGCITPEAILEQRGLRS